MATNRSQKHINTLNDQFLSLQTELETLNRDLTSLNIFISENINDPSTDGSTDTPKNPHEAERRRIASTYTKAILKSLYNRFTALDKGLGTASSGVDKLKKKLLYKLSLGYVYSDQDVGDEWGYFDEWIEEIKELHGVVRMKFCETPT